MPTRKTFLFVFSTIVVLQILLIASQLVALWPYFPKTAVGLGALFATGFCAFLWMFLVFWQSDGLENAKTTALSRVAFLYFGAMAALFSSSILTWYATPTYRWLAWAAFLSFGLFGAFRAPRIQRVKLAAPSEALKGVKFAQISDLHLGTWINEKMVTRWLKNLHHEAYDFLVLTGDIGDGDPSAREMGLKPIQNLDKPVVAVIGNHETYWETAAWIESFKKFQFKVVDHNSTVQDVKNLKVCVSGYTDGKDIRPIDVPKADYHISLVHQPRYAAQVESYLHPDLILSGHTHGGQFWPWTWVVHFIHKFRSGLYSLEKTQLYVNPGTGFWGPPLRVGARSEITLFELV